MASMHSGSPSKPSPTALTTPAAPTPHPGERLASFFESMFKTITAISTLGASLTFSKTLAVPTTPWKYHGITGEQMQYYTADAFLCFLLALFLTTLAASALTNWRPQAISYFGTEDSHRRRIVAWWATLVSTILSGLILAAFLFLGLVVAGMTGLAGWFALGFTALMGIMVMGVIVWQSPIGSPPPHAHRRHSRQKLHKPMPRFGSYHSSVGSRRDDDEFVVGEFVSEDKVDVFSDPGGNIQGYRRQEEEYGYEEELGRNTYVDGSGYAEGRAYADEPLSRSTTIARPTVAAVPPYTEDLRRQRHMKYQEDYDARY